MSNQEDIGGSSSRRESRRFERATDSDRLTSREESRSRLRDGERSSRMRSRESSRVRDVERASSRIRHMDRGSSRIRDTERASSRVRENGKSDEYANDKNERELERKIKELEDKKKELEDSLGKYKELFGKERDEVEELVKSLKKEKNANKQSTEANQLKVTELSSQLKKSNDELLENQKIIQKRDQQLTESKMKYEETINTLTLTKNSYQKVDIQLKFAQKTFDSTEKSIRKLNSNIEKTAQKLKETESALHLAKETLETDRENLNQTKKTYAEELQILEKELYEEITLREKILKAKADAEEENETLLTYYIPPTQLIDDGRPKRKRYVFDFVAENRNAIEKELEDLRAVTLDIKVKKVRYLQEMQDSLKKTLAALPEDFRDDLSFELEDLMRSMTLAGIKTKEKLFIFTSLVENACDPGIVRELAVLTEDMIENKKHLMEEPEALVTLSLRDISNEPENPKAFSNALLYRLAVLRARRTKKDIEYCKIVILEGGEYDD